MRSIPPREGTMAAWEMEAARGRWAEGGSRAGTAKEEVSEVARAGRADKAGDAGDRGEGMGTASPEGALAAAESEEVDGAATASTVAG